MAYNSEVIAALAQLATATGALADKTGEDKDDAKELAKEMMSAQVAAKMQASMSVFNSGLKMQTEMTQNSLLSLSELNKKMIETGTFESDALDTVRDAEEITYFGGTGLFTGGTPGAIRRDFKDFVDANEELITSQSGAISKVMAQKELGGKDAVSVVATKNKLIQLRNNIQSSIDMAKETQQFDKKRRAPVTSAIVGFFGRNEAELVKESEKQINTLNGIIDYLEK